MYVYSFNYSYYDDYHILVLQSKIKYTREQLYEILYSVLSEIYKKEEFPPLPCLLNFGDALYYMTEEPYKTFLRENYFLVPFDFDIVLNLEGLETNRVDNLGCHDECISRYKKNCKWRSNNE